MDLLLHLVNKILEINKKAKNKFKDNIRSMIDSLLESVNKISESNKKISQETLIKRFLNTYQLCNKDLNKFTLLLRKGVYPCEYMNSWEKFNETSLPVKKYFYSELNKEPITDEDYSHVQKVWDTFKIT